MPDKDLAEKIIYAINNKEKVENIIKQAKKQAIKKSFSALNSCGSLKRFMIICIRAELL